MAAAVPTTILGVGATVTLRVGSMAGSRAKAAARGVVAREASANVAVLGSVHSQLQRLSPTPRP